MNENEEYLDQINSYWGDLWRNSPEGLNFLEKCTQFKFQFFLKPFLDKLPTNATVCELGSGNCQWLLLIRSYRPDLQLFGIDISEQAKTFANLYGIEFTQADVRNIPIKDSLFDFTYSWGVIEHMNESDIALKEQYRISKTYLVADVPFRHSLGIIPVMNDIKRKKMSTQEAMIKHGKIYSRKAFKNLVSSVVSQGDIVSYKNNYVVFPHNKIGKLLDNICPNFIRNYWGHNIGVLIQKS